MPTFDPAGHLAGVLTGGIRIAPRPSRAPKQTQQNQELGFTGLTIVDRAGQLITENLKRVADRAVLRQMNRRSRRAISRGRPASRAARHHVIAFATSKTLDWKVAIDRSESGLYGSARRSLYHRPRSRSASPRSSPC